MQTNVELLLTYTSKPLLRELLGAEKSEDAPVWLCGLEHSWFCMSILQLRVCGAYHASSALTFALQEQGAWPKKWLSEEVTPLTQLSGSDVCESSTDVRAN